MGFYDRHILPILLDKGMDNESVYRQRALIVPRATGQVLEIGIGSGLNLEHYDPAKVTRVIGIEPSHELRHRAAPRAARASFPVEFIGLTAEEIPLSEASVDTVLVTYTLCTIPDVSQALLEMRRILKPGGQLLFCEHGRSPDQAIRKWQDRLDRLWGRFTGGCHLNRSTPELLAASGLKVTDLESAYVEGLPKLAGYTYRGAAERA